MFNLNFPIIAITTLATSIAFAGKPTQNSTPQEVEVINTDPIIVKLDPNSPVVLDIYNLVNQYEFAGYTDTFVTTVELIYSGTLACQAKFPAGKVSTGEEIRRAIESRGSNFALPPSDAIFTAHNGIGNTQIDTLNDSFPNSFGLRVDSAGRIGQAGSGSYRVACSAPSP